MQVENKRTMELCTCRGSSNRNASTPAAGRAEVIARGPKVYMACIKIAPFVGMLQMQANWFFLRHPRPTMFRGHVHAIGRVLPASGFQLCVCMGSCAAKQTAAGLSAVQPFRAQDGFKMGSGPKKSPMCFA